MMVSACSARSSAAWATSRLAPGMPFTSSTIWMWSHMAGTDNAPSHRCQRYARSSPPKSASLACSRSARKKLHAIMTIDADPMNNAKPTLSSPIVSSKANHPMRIDPIAMTGPAQWRPGCGTPRWGTRSRRQSLRRPVIAVTMRRPHSVTRAHCAEPWVEEPSSREWSTASVPVSASAEPVWVVSTCGTLPR